MSHVLYLCLDLQIAPPVKIESGFQTSSSLSYTPSPSSPSGGVYTIGGGSPLPHNGYGMCYLKTIETTQRLKRNKSSRTKLVDKLAIKPEL